MTHCRLSVSFRHATFSKSARQSHINTEYEAFRLAEVFNSILRLSLGPSEALLLPRHIYLEGLELFESAL